MIIPRFGNRTLSEAIDKIYNKALTAKLRFQRRKDKQFGYLPVKQFAELLFWKECIQKRIQWYTGALHLLQGVPSPSEEMKVKGHDITTNAIMTWNKAAFTGKYLHALKVDEDYFSGKSVLDIGCGPIPHLLAFRGCQRYAMDQLIEEYKLIGFPLEHYKSDITYLAGPVESIPAEDNSFDAVISVNAIDHVDDFGSAAREIKRVLKLQGIVRMQVHYHPPTVYEPLSIDDEMMMEHFGDLGIKKVSEESVPGRPWEKLVVWSTHE